MLHGDFGTSIHFRRGVAGLIGSTLPATIELALLAMIVAGTLGIAGGLFLFHVRGTRKEPIADAGSIVLLSLPEFLWGLFFILLFGVALELLPFTGRLTAGFQRPVVTGFLLLDTLLVGRPDMFLNALEAHDPAVARARHRVRADHHARAALEPARRLPGGLHPSGAAARLLRAAHPAAPRAARTRSCRRLSLMGVQFGFLFGGTLLIEVIYSYPGLGNLMVDAVRNADLPIIQAVGLTYCVVVLTINTVVDAAYVILNPKLRIA